MYYSGYGGSISPLGTSYSASYLNPGSSYSNHSSLGGYSRTPVTRWIPSVTRSYSPMLSTISERSTASPARINSPRRIPITKRSYASSHYTPRPININTADIDVSRDKYKHKIEHTPARSEKYSPPTPKRRESPVTEQENGPFMPRIDGKPETGIDSSPGLKRSTIKRGRTVVRLHTVKRKERDSPRKPIESFTCSTPLDSEIGIALETVQKEPEQLKWREKLSKDLIYKDKKEKKTLGTKLVEKFTLRDRSDKKPEITTEEGALMHNNVIPSSNSQENILPSILPGTNKLPDRRCSMELLAEQASLLDSLIRQENLSTVTLDLSKLGVEEKETIITTETFGRAKRRKSKDKSNPLKTTKSDHSLHVSLKTSNENKDNLIRKNLPKRKSIKKSSSGSSICRLDSITELPKEPIQIDFSSIEESGRSTEINVSNLSKETIDLTIKDNFNDVSIKELPKTSIEKDVQSIEIHNILIKRDSTIPNEILQSSLAIEPDKICNEFNIKEKPKPKLKAIITSTVEVTAPRSPLKLVIEDVVIEEKPRIPRKSITFVSEVEEIPKIINNIENTKINNNEFENLKKKKPVKCSKSETEISSPGAEDINFWDKIGKRETVYLVKRKQNIDAAREKSKRNLFWFPENEEEQATVSDELHANNSIPKTTEINTFINSTDSTINVDAITRSVLHDCIDNLDIQVCDTDADRSNIALKTISVNNNSIPTKTKENITDLKQTEHEDLYTFSPRKDKMQELSFTTEVENKNTLIKSVSNEIKTSELLSSTVTKNVKESDNTKLSSNLLTNTEIDESNVKVKKTLLVSDQNVEQATEIIDKSQLVFDDSQNKYDKKITSKTEILNNVTEDKKDKDTTQSTVIIFDDIAKILPNQPEKEIIINSCAKIVEKIDELAIKNQESNKELETVKEELNIMKKDNDIKPKVKLLKNKSEPKVSKLTGEATSKKKRTKSTEGLKSKSKENSVKKPSIPKILKQVKMQDIKNNSLEKSNVNETCLPSTLEFENSAMEINVSQEGKKVEVIEKQNNDSHTNCTCNKLNNCCKKDSLDKFEIVHCNLKQDEEREQIKDEKANSITSDGLNGENTLELNKKDNELPTLSTISNLRENVQDDKVEISSKEKAYTVETETSKSINLVHNTSPIDENIQISVEKTENIPLIENKVALGTNVQSNENSGEGNKAESNITVSKDVEKEVTKRTSVKGVINVPPITGVRKLPKEEAAPKILIATPRPLQRKNPQIIHSSDSSDSSSDEDSSEDEEESESSEGSGEFFECEANADGRTSTGSNDSGFDSSAPTSPTAFMEIKKGNKSRMTYLTQTNNTLLQCIVFLF